MMSDLYQPPLAELYAPSDVEEQHDKWGASCGPASLAALLRVPVADVARHFERPWTTPTAMRAALDARGVRHSLTPVRGKGRDVRARPPRHGLVFVQISGPWLTPGVPAGAAYQHTHWIAVHGDWVYDINARNGFSNQAGGWVTMHVWASEVIVELIRGHKRADGRWYMRQGVEVERRSA